ncbi:MAG: alpha/beta hydrolase, partial [Pseudomonadota bacterium]
NDFSKLFSITALRFEDFSDAMSEGLQMTVLCMEDHQFNLRQTAEQPSFEKLIHLSVEGSFAKSCELVPSGNLPDEYFEPIKTNVPALILSGNFDPVTPPYWGEQMEAELSHHQHIVVSGGHHIVSFLGCIPDLVTGFINAPDTIGNIDAGCVKKIKPLHFFIDNAGPALVLNQDRQNEGQP